MRIFKYQLDSVNQSVTVPRGAKLLKIMMQSGQPTAWFEVDEKQPMENRRIHWVVTGGSPPPHATYIDTLCIDGFHIIHFYDEDSGV